MTNPAPDLDLQTRLGLLLERHVADAATTPPLAEVLAAALYDPLRDFLNRPGKELRAGLVHAAYELAGPSRPMPGELPCIIELLHAGSLIIDDIQDGSPTRRGEPALHVLHGVPLALNAGNWTYFWAQTLISRLGIAPRAELALHQRVAGALLACHEGQALDLALRIDQVPVAQVPALVRATTALKTGRLMQLAAELGALGAEAEPARVDALAAFGHRLGVGLQMLDDLSGLTSARRRAKGYEDLRGARPTWPWAWLVEHAPAELVESCREQQRRVVSGERPDDLARLLRGAVADIGRSAAHAELWGAVDELRQRIGFSPVLANVHADLKRLEKSYD